MSRATPPAQPRVKKVVYHQMLRPPPGEGGALTDSVMAQRAAAHAKAMGYFDGQWIAIRHGNHIHIVANRVLLDGSLVSDSHDWRRAEASVRAIEKQFGLTQVESSRVLEPEKAETHTRAPSQAEMALAEKGEASARLQIQNLILSILDRPCSFTEFADQLFELWPTLGGSIRFAISIVFAVLERRPEPELVYVTISQSGPAGASHLCARGDCSRRDGGSRLG